MERQIHHFHIAHGIEEHLFLLVREGPAIMTDYYDEHKQKWIKFTGRKYSWLLNSQQ